ncbi:MAG TPA: chromosome segregation SMC family protein [Nitrosarchaeum sp.]|nr:chromosome segregation SMC family protein [Nitrosarchaeum sp.]
MVHIKKVEIFGFKSFGFKNTTVMFEPGLVSISGPNGSGKSNILDAIIFALGENKPKMMRVDKLRSLIHDIEGNRHGPKIARSSVHFDNSDRKIPIDSDAVEITREMDDKGENNYYLNKKPTNRSQILDILDVANAGLGQLNAVQQGTVTRISEFTSEEKRKTIEDLIGLSYFDEKKTEAIKQLDDADRRLEIALAKMGEIKKRIDELEEERNQKLRHDMLDRELNRYRAIAASNKLKIILSQKSSKEDTFNKITSEVTKFDEERTLLRNEINSLENEKSKLMSVANDYSQAKAAIDSELSSAMEQYEIDNSAIVASTKRLQQIDFRFPEIKNEIQTIDLVRNEIDTYILESKKEINEINIKKQKVNDDLEILDSERNKILTEQSVAASKKSEIDNKIKLLSEQLNEAKLKLSKEENEFEESQIKIKSNSTKLSDFEKSVVELSALKSRLESKINNHNDSISELKSRISKLNLKKSKTLNDLEELDLILEKSSKAAAQYDAKIKTVKGIMHEDYTVAKLKEDADKLGIVGLVYEMISWDKQYDRSVLAVSSDWIKAIVVPDFATLLGIAEVARSKNLPKLKIIPLDAIPQFKLNLPKESGVIGVLSDYVRCNPSYSALKTFLFGNVVLANSRDSAYRISKLGHKAVTLDGEYFEAKGGAVVIDINSKISKLTKIISMSTDIDGLLESINLLKRYVSKKKHSLKKLEDSIQNHMERLSLSEQDLASTDENYSHLQSRISSAIIMKQHLAERISELNKRSITLLAEIASAESHIDSLNSRIALVEENYASGEQTRIANELSRVNAKKSDLEKLYTTIMNEYRDKDSKLTTLQADENRKKSQIKSLHDEESSLISQRQELENKIKELEIRKESKTAILVTLREKEQDLISTSGSSIGQLKEYDDKLKVLSEKDKELTKEINSLERQSDSLTRDLHDLTENETKLQTLLSSFGFDKNMETFDVESIVHGLTTELNSLNALNAKAPETYLEVSYGYRSMSVRKNSLEEERNSIVKFIEDIEKDKRQTFLDAFDKVDKEIRLIFNKMTGGNAWLELQNEDDIFNSGISYMIQFPNKPKRESTSISGGEKTLAAIVFVLALQKLKPSPFYLFDEVDAHLDAPNSERLAKILEERSHESQFIMVSLKDSVIQKAKLIYGVYPKNGVSYIVTYKDKRMPSVKTS